MLEGATTLPTLETERLTIRWLEDRDVPRLFEIFSNPEVMRYWSSPPLEDIRGAEELLREIRQFFESRTLFQWGVALKEDDRVIGTCTLSSLSASNRRAEIGYALGRAWWGKGYMTEALPALLRFAFGPLGLHRIEADVDPRNLPSLRSVESLGFRREGYLRERYFVNGEVQDSVIYGLLRSEAAPELTRQ
ncbi:MAG TPA: GNAT family protein [Thermoanaerobaculia bacterium]|nr:GNAT family protein [Thermoanaerobaculia bacterium]